MTPQAAVSVEALPIQDANPYKPPATDPDVASQPGNEPTDAELRAFVGRNAEVYLRKWAPMRRPAPLSPGRSWPAFFFGFLFLLYRRMYRHAAFVAAFLFGEGLLEEVLFVDILGQQEPPSLFGRAIGLALAVYCAMFANVWYYRLARRKILELRSLHPEGPELEAALARAGGTRLRWALLAVLLVAGLTILGLWVSEGGLDTLNIAEPLRGPTARVK